MYISTQTRVVALNPESGKEIWSYDVAGGQASPRGVAYWPGDRQNPARIMFTAGRNLVALNAGTGKLDPGFAKEGILDMVVPYNGVPTIFKNLVLVGASTGEKENGPPGNSRAFDARTGAKLWEFQSIPGPGQVGHESWLSDGWKDRSGANIWGWYMTADEERGILYMPFGAAAANYYGGDRPGANLFGNSVVAVDANTGKYKWHFQVVHHDLWDYDMPPAPGLVDIVKDGKKIPALAAMGKSGWMFILDRVTGKPVFGVEERAVPKGDVPGEWYSPTQPFPLKPPALARTSLKREDLVTAEDTTPEHAKACLELWEKNLFYNDGPFTPWLFHEEGAPPRVTISFPGATGGASWGGMASDPKSGYIFVQSKDSPLTGWIEKKKEGTRYENANLPYDRVNGTVGAFSVGELAVLQTAMEPHHRGERQHRRHRVADDAGHQPVASGRQAQRGRIGQRGSDGHRRRPGVRRRGQRQSLPGVRFENRERAVGRPARPAGQRGADDVSRQERQAVRRGHGLRYCRRVRAAVS